MVMVEDVLSRGAFWRPLLVRESGGLQALQSQPSHLLLLLPQQPSLPCFWGVSTHTGEYE